MRLSTYLVTALMLSGVIGGAVAQRPPGFGGPPRMGGPMDPGAREWGILNQLGLNAAQKKKAKVLTGKFGAQAKAVFAQRKPGEDFGAMRTKFKPIRDQYQKALAKVLSPAQMAKYTKLREEMRGRFGGMGRPGGPGASGGPPGRRGG